MVGRIPNDVPRASVPCAGLFPETVAQNRREEVRMGVSFCCGRHQHIIYVDMLDLQSGTPSSMAGVRFLEMLGEDDMAFDNLYCVAFRMMDAQWLAKHASYMEFNEVLKSTRTQLERELALDDTSSVKDLPAYNMLNR